MEDLEFELERIINNKINENIRILNAKVISYDLINMTVDIENNTFKRLSIPLRSNIRNITGFIIIPKLLSYVTLLIQKYQEKENIRILNYSDIEKIIIKTELSNIEVTNQDITINMLNNISLIANKIYINTNNELEPILKGETTKTHIENIYNYLYDIYSQIITPHTGNLGAPTIVNPTVIANSGIKQGEIDTLKSILDNIKSLKNFTE